MKQIKLVILSYFLIVFGCRYDQSSNTDNTSGNIDTEFNQEKEDIRKVYYRFPSPDEMFSFVDSTGMQFDNFLLHPIDKIDNYLESLDQAINMGVYIADLSYITLFQRYKESMDYLQTVYALSEKLRISSAFERKLIKRIENNIRNVDSLKSISEDSFTSIVNYLSRNDKENVFAIISLGSFVEFLYISINLVGDYSPENIAIMRILDQKSVLENIVKYSKQHLDDENVTTALNIINPLVEYFNRLPVEKKKTTVTKRPDGQLVFGGGKKYQLTETEFNELKRITLEVRSKITSAEF